MTPLLAPDCNPLNYGIWGLIAGKTCSTQHRSVVELKAWVKWEWAAMPEAFVKACEVFRTRLVQQPTVAAEGSHFELIIVPCYILQYHVSSFYAIIS